MKTKIINQQYSGEHKERVSDIESPFKNNDFRFKKWNQEINNLLTMYDIITQKKQA